MDEIAFTRDIAVLAAQVAPVLVVAFVVEVRSLGERRSMSGKDARSFPMLVFGALAIVLFAASMILLGPERSYGLQALWSWLGVGLPTIFLVAMVAAAAWAGLTVSSFDGAEERKRQEQVNAVLNAPGWLWFFRGGKGIPAPHPSAAEDEAR